MPYFCRSVISQALNHGLQRSVSGSKILLLGVAYKADIGDTRETPAEKLVELLRTAGADVSYHDPHVPEFDGMTRRAARARGLRLRRDRDRALGDRLRRPRAARAGRRRLPQRDERARGRGQGLEAVEPVRIGQAGLGAWGKNIVRNLDDLAHLAWICDPTEAPAQRVRAALPGRARHGRLRRDARGRRARGGRDRDARADALRAREAGARGGQARLRREAAGDARRGDGRARRPRRASATSC